ncbi:MAG: glycosyltransferase family 4 protein [Candidatus Latescibacterota bacterium]
MKVCHLTSVHVPFDTRIFTKECRSLARAGHEVHLVAGHISDEIRDGVHLHSVNKSAGRIKRMTVTVSHVFRKALEIDADIYHFHDPELVPVGLLLKLRGKRVIYDIHEDYSSWLTFNEGIPSWLRNTAAQAFTGLEGLAVRRFDALVTVTPSIYHHFEAMNRRTVLVRNFPREEEFAPDGEGDIPWESRENAVCYIGGIFPKRGLAEMVRAVSLVRESIPAKLLLGGDITPAARELLDRLPAREMEPVECFGRVSRSQIAEIFRRSKAGLTILHPERNFLVSYPTKLFEYLSAGLPVVCSDFPLFRELDDGTGACLFVDPLDPRAIADAILHLLTHPEEAEAMGRRGRSAIRERFNWSSEERTLLELYESLLPS